MVGYAPCGSMGFFKGPKMRFWEELEPCEECSAWQPDERPEGGCPPGMTWWTDWEDTPLKRPDRKSSLFFIRKGAFVQKNENLCSRPGLQ
jgi:hypothetical protein